MRESAKNSEYVLGTIIPPSQTHRNVIQSSRQLGSHTRKNEVKRGHVCNGDTDPSMCPLKNDPKQVKNGDTKPVTSNLKTDDILSQALGLEDAGVIIPQELMN